MKRSHKKMLLVLGLLCLLLLGLGSWHSLVYNNGRLLYPMELESYRFSPKDLPLLAALVLTQLYVIALVVLLLRRGLRQRQQQAASQHTRSLSPKLGLLGFLGFLGFGGFWYSEAFAFFLFLGFFGFFYEGKLSNTLMDERYRENRQRAQLEAGKVFSTLMFLALIALGGRRPFGQVEYSYSALLIVLSLGLGLELFLQEYLLYRYDQQDLPPEED